MAAERKTTGLLMVHLPKPLALLAESYIMAKESAGPEVHFENILAGHMESAFIYRNQDELDDSLVAACKYQNLEIVDSLISSGAKNFSAALIMAIDHDNAECVRYLAPYGPDLNDGLRNSTKVKNLEMAKLLISLGATKYDTLFLGSGKFEFVSLGLSLGAVPKPIHVVIATQQASLGEMILFKHHMIYGFDFVIQAAIMAGWIKIVELFWDHHGDVGWDPNDYFVIACDKKDAAMMKFLISHGATACRNCGRPMDKHIPNLSGTGS